MTGKPYVPTCMNRGGEIDPIALGCLVPGCTSEVGVACRMPTALGAEAATPSHGYGAAPAAECTQPQPKEKGE